MPRMRAFRIKIMNLATSVPVFRLDRRKLMMVATNMAALARLENPLRLSNFGGLVLGHKEVGLRDRRDEHKANDRHREKHNKDSCYQNCG